MKEQVGFAIGAICAVALVAACKSKEAPPKYTPVSLEEATAFAAELGQAFEDCHAGALDELIDFDAILRAALVDVPITDVQRRGVIRGAKQDSSLGAQFCQDVAAGSRYDLLHIHEQDGAPRLLFRAVGADGLTYIDFRIGRTAGQQRIRIFDYYMYANGQSAVEMFEEVFRALTTEDEQKRVWATSSTINRVNELVEKGEHEQAYAVFDELSPALKKRKPLMLNRVMIAANLADDVYAAAIHDYEAAFPGDPSLDLISIDGHVMRKQHAEALAAIDRLDQRVAGDPYLDVMRAYVLMDKGEHAEARKLVERAIAGDETLQDAYWNLVTIALAQKDDGEVVRVFGELERRFGVEIVPANIEQEPVYADFVQTDVYRTWRAGRQAAAPDGE